MRNGMWQWLKHVMIIFFNIELEDEEEEEKNGEWLNIEWMKSMWRW